MASSDLFLEHVAYGGQGSINIGGYNVKLVKAMQKLIADTGGVYTIEGFVFRYVIPAKM